MIDSINKIRSALEECSLLQTNENANVDNSERVISIATGTFILFKGLGNLFSHPLLAMGEVALGGALLHRGVTGYCRIKEMVDEPKNDDIIVTEMHYMTTPE